MSKDQLDHSLIELKLEDDVEVEAMRSTPLTILWNMAGEGLNKEGGKIMKKFGKE